MRKAGCCLGFRAFRLLVLGCKIFKKSRKKTNQILRLWTRVHQTWTKTCYNCFVNYEYHDRHKIESAQGIEKDAPGTGR